MRRLREITDDQRKAFLAAYLGWVLDGFDFYILTFLLSDIQRTFSVTNAASVPARRRIALAVNRRSSSRSSGIRSWRF
jgi:hypothetical protein